jgi:anaerobic selenocysteine-containing dehydrogenase
MGAEGQCCAQRKGDGGIMIENGAVKSVCPYCATGCGLVVEVRNGRVRSVRGDRTHPSNFGSLCRKGAMLDQILDTPDRLLYPQMRESLDQPFRRVTWDEAIAFAASRFKASIARGGPDSVAFYGSGQLLTEDYYLFGKLAKGYIGTNNQDTNSRLCMTSASGAYSLAFGVDGPPCAYEDIEAADTFFILGANIEACHPVLFKRIEQRKRRNRHVKVIVVDPRRTATAAIADIHLALRPGTDVALLNSMLAEIVIAGLVDQAFIDAHTEDWDSVLESVKRYTAERMARGIGVEAEDIRRAALTYASAGAALSLWTMGANQSTAGVDKNLALINLALATGNIGRPGAGPFSLTGQPNAMGGREAGGLSHTLPGHRSVANPEHRHEMEEFWGLPAESISAKPGLTAVEMFEAIGKRQVTAVWIAATNPVASMPDADAVRQALQRADVVVAQDAYHPTETTELAHVLLPAAQWSERAGTMTNAERRVSLLEQATAAPGEALPDWQILCRFAAAMGHGAAFCYADERAIFEELKQTTAGRDLDMTGMNYNLLRASGGLQWPLPEGKRTGTKRLYADGVFPTPSGRARFHAVEYRPASEPINADFPFVLTTGRVKDQWHTRTRTGKVKKLVASDPEPFIEISSFDARDLGIESGKLVEVASRRSCVRLKARVTDTMRPGVLFVPFHWSRLWSPESDVNRVMNSAFDPISKEPELKYTAVTLRRA